MAYRKKGASQVAQSAYDAGDLDLIPGSGRFPREEKGNPLQYSWLENFMDRGARRATVHGVTKSHSLFHRKKPRQQSDESKNRNLQQASPVPASSLSECVRIKRNVATDER